VRDHRRRVAGDPIAVKGRLNEPALALVVRVLAGQQAVAEQDPGALEAEPLVEQAGARGEDVADVIGMVEECERLAGDVEGHDVTVAPRERLDDPDAVLDEGEGGEAWNASDRSRRTHSTHPQGIRDSAGGSAAG